ncbi:NhaC family Na+:H+ antiporter [Vreelandella songnenensis]|uniref:NhaC family Na+:H+ antiporter n=1 Tax=Vreelandella songnenensis TaxID=1176243 RepID=A0A2T0UYK5_9GAMM|nr:Na+/H+ antiporter NhaC family protein [Halomonas songnenensis]PRY63015.1 NhaC family Na+:H+ antiporter [Halomonas songnenensis]
MSYDRSEPVVSPALSGVHHLVLLLVAIGSLLAAIMWLSIPTAVALIVAGSLAITLCLVWGVPWERLEADLLSGIQAMLIPILILICVGMMVGVWMLSGTIPAMVTLGLELLTPALFLVVACLSCSLMSVMAGTSWGTLSTIGVALMGVAAGLDIPLAWAAGAIVTGTFFGDKLSPLSDTTVMASAVCEVNIVTHIRHMLYSTLPAYLIALGVYAWLGSSISGTQDDTPAQTALLVDTLHQVFSTNVITFLPPVVVFICILLKKPVLPSFAVGIVCGALIALLLQGASLSTIGQAMNGGYSSSTGVEMVDSMLSRGGLQSMMSTVAVLIAAAVLGAPFKSAGTLDAAIILLNKRQAGRRQVLGSAMGLHSLAFLLTGSYYVTFALLGPLLRPLVANSGTPTKNLSRILEDTGTTLSPLIPWGVTGAFTAATLGVSTADFLVYAILCYGAIAFSLFYVVSGIGLGHKTRDSK